MSLMWLRTALIGLLLCMPPPLAFAVQPAEDPYASGRLIVFFQAGASPERRHALSASNGLVARVRVSATGAHLLSLRPGTTALEARQLADQLRARADVASVAPDVIVRPTANPGVAFPLAGPSYADNPTFSNVLSLLGSRQIFSTINATLAPVAVVDTGITSHSLLQTVLPGYNFYTLLGNSRSSDYSDQGDWALAGECGNGKPSQMTNSSWHGTAVAGLIGAPHSDGYHVEGVAPGTPILPLRALGKCGGYLTDIIDAALWSAGVHVGGVPDNGNPARIVNMSLGAAGFSCAPYQSAIDQLRALGVTVIAAGGNNNEDTANVLPANCNGVLAVAASDRNGNLAPYSASGSNLTVIAPGGADNQGIFTTSDMGTQSPAGETSAAYFGTSISTAIVSGVVSLMLSANPALQPDNVKKILRATATPIATCPANCGAGLLGADAAVRLAYEGVSYVSPGFPNVNIGGHVDALLQVSNTSGLPVTLGSAAFGGLNPADFTKTADACSGTTLNADDTCSVTIRFAPTVVGPRRATLQIPSNMPSMGIGVPLSGVATAPVSNATGSQGSSSGGGGGGCAIAGIHDQPHGQLDPLLPLLLMVSVVWLARRRRGHPATFPAAE